MDCARRCLAQNRPYRSELWV